MKERNRILLLSILPIIALLIFSSCNQNPEVQYGKLSLNMNSSKSIEVEGDREKYELTSFTVYAIYQNGVDSIEESFTTASHTIEQMKAGLWEIYIKGFNSDGTYMAVSEKQIVEIIPASNNSITIVLDYLNNEGSFSLEITIPAGYVDISRIIGTITQGSIVADKSFDESERTNDGDVDYFIWEGNLTPGTYNLRVELFDLNGNPHDITHLETITIAPNEETSGLIAVEEKHLPVDIPVITEEIDGYTSRITITTTTKDAKIYYTTDGSTPTALDTEYTGIIETGRLTVRYRAVALKDNIQNSNSEYETKKGPAGGYVFYDCDADNDTGNADGLISSECGWRYLEAAPNDLRVVNGVPTVDSEAEGYSSGNKYHIFGYHRASSSGSNLYVNGTTTYSETDCTVNAIGSGEKNTEKLVKAMGTSAYTSDSVSGKTPDYAARLCSVLSHGGYDDWFLPSRDELDLMWYNLYTEGIGSFSTNNYWSSSERNDDARYAWLHQFAGGRQKYGYRGSPSTDTRANCVRPCRAF